MSRCSTCQSAVLPGSVFCDTCGAAVAQVQAARKLRQSSFQAVKQATHGLLAPGEKLRNYVIEESIAKSGFGATFRATRLKDNHQVLIKQMLDQASYDQFRDALLKAFKREAKFLQNIRHPAFPRGFDYFEKNKSFYLVMEFINGKELAKALSDHRAQKGKVEDGMLVYLGIEIADALEVIHAKGFIYRDLKPQNVMLDGISGKIKLIDFGTLYAPSDRDPLLFESEGYTPPEFLDKGQKFLPTGDIYSLGALLFEAAMGRTPTFGEKLQASGRDARLVALINRCLEKDPQQRFARARHLRDELTKLTRKGFWPFFRQASALSPVELSVLPKTLFPSQCTFCDYCGFSDPASQYGYCPKCRIPLKVGRLEWETQATKREFFLNAKENTLGKAADCEVSFKDLDKTTLLPKHARIVRRKTALWLEAFDKNTPEEPTLNQRKVLGPVELKEGDRIQLGELVLHFSLRNAC